MVKIKKPTEPKDLQGKDLKYYKTIVDPKNHVAMYVVIVFKHKKTGELFSFRASRFAFDLDKYEEK